jgi:hypothetical protein
MKPNRKSYPVCHYKTFYGELSLKDGDVKKYLILASSRTGATYKISRENGLRFLAYCHEDKRSIYRSNPKGITLEILDVEGQDAYLLTVRGEKIEEL